MIVIASSRGRNYVSIGASPVPGYGKVLFSSDDGKVILSAIEGENISSYDGELISRVCLYGYD
jgi:hypothetical protein